jgi:hypothetical protein
MGRDTVQSTTMPRASAAAKFREKEEQTWCPSSNLDKDMEPKGGEGPGSHSQCAGKRGQRGMLKGTVSASTQNKTGTFHGSNT